MDMVYGLKLILVDVFLLSCPGTPIILSLLVLYFLGFIISPKCGDLLYVFTVGLYNF